LNFPSCTLSCVHRFLSLAARFNILNYFSLLPAMKIDYKPFGESRLFKVKFDGESSGKSASEKRPSFGVGCKFFEYTVTQHFAIILFKN